MKSKTQRKLFALVFVLGWATHLRAEDAGTAFTYQGYLVDGDGPVNNQCTFAFYLFDQETGGTLLESTAAMDTTNVTDGIFTVSVDFGPTDDAGQTPMDGSARWLHLFVFCQGDSSWEELAPRQKITPAPLAMAIPGLRIEQNNANPENAESPNLVGGFAENHVELGVNGGTIGGGGAASTSTIGHCNGSPSDLCFNDTDCPSGTCASHGTQGACSENPDISCVDSAGCPEGICVLPPGPNEVFGHFSFLGGGASNIAGGDDEASARAGGRGLFATLVGGQFNRAPGIASTAVGGAFNRARGTGSTVVGGSTNGANALMSVVSGGFGNAANGKYSTIPGGAANVAGGDYSFAAGRRAKIAAGDAGTFMWADSTNADFNSTGPNQFLIRAAGGVGIGMNAPTAQLDVLQPAAGKAAVRGEGTGAASTGIHGIADNGGEAYGVWGTSVSGYGVVGDGAKRGVWGTATGPGAIAGVEGKAGTSGIALPAVAGVNGDTNDGIGVIGTSSAVGQMGVLGVAPRMGVLGVANDALTGFAVVGRSGGSPGFPFANPAGVLGEGILSNGVQGLAVAAGRAGVNGTFFSGAAPGLYPGGQGAGVFGESGVGHGSVGVTSAANHYGILGVAGNSSSVGVSGINAFGIGVKGVFSALSTTNLIGVYIPAVWGDSNAGNGVMGTSDAPNRAGVFGKCDNAVCTGVSGKSPSSVGVMGGSNTGVAVLGSLQSASTVNLAGVLNSGVWGDSLVGQGVVGTSSANGAAGVYGRSNNAGGFGIRGVGDGSAKAGRFDGDVEVTGMLSKGGGTFKIDHPLDPTNKYLVHSFVESPDMKNIYDGIARLDAQGQAVVTLPAYFGALNADFRYGLTALDGPAPNLHIAKRIENNQFTISGGNPGQEISWQVTGIRIDAFAQAHRPQVEIEKDPDVRGKFLHPVEHGQPESQGMLASSNHRFLPEIPVDAPADDILINSFEGDGPGGLKMDSEGSALLKPGVPESAPNLQSLFRPADIMDADQIEAAELEAQWQKRIQADQQSAPSPDQLP